MHSSESGPPSHDDSVVSEWITRFGQLVPSGGRILDVACGAGRHAHWFAERGFRVDAVDREILPRLSSRIAFKQADIEQRAWPYADQCFDAVVVANYLHRPLMKTLVESVAPCGWFIYETFAAGNEQFGKPTRPDFLLQPGELLDAVRGHLRVIAYEVGYVDAPKPAVVQRIAARNVTD